MTVGPAGIQWNPKNLSIPRIRLWPSDGYVLVFVGISDGNCDPVVGVDLYWRGRVADRVGDWLWERGRRKQARR